MSASLPPGPRAPGFVQAIEYTARFPRYTARLHARYGPSYTLRIPGLPATVITADRALIRHMLTGDPLARRHAKRPSSASLRASRAGHESTATAIAWAADILAHDGDAAERLQDAVREGDDGHVARAAREVLRLRTVAPRARGVPGGRHRPLRAGAHGAAREARSPRAHARAGQGRDRAAAAAPVGFGTWHSLRPIRAPPRWSPAPRPGSASSSRAGSRRAATT